MQNFVSTNENGVMSENDLKNTSSKVINKLDDDNRKMPSLVKITSNFKNNGFVEFSKKNSANLFDQSIVNRLKSSNTEGKFYLYLLINYFYHFYIILHQQKFCNNSNVIVFAIC